ncbi:transposase [Mesorhizobium sp. DCY119]|uniref:transposase n=1 Tax=Mesorhizobium sp. DCY119 TaxID=2108445 RepID=UPI000E6C5FEE|nr:transposase [Mesorhizobium sp. DCY119]RJG46286.1 hypothetical protein D3Y55_19925 [Mesorhizobium sp. DCY119]
MNRKYSDQQRAAAVAMVDQRRVADPRDHTIFREVAQQSGVGEQSLRLWVRAADEKRLEQRGGLEPNRKPRSEDELVQELNALRRKIQKLQAENEVLKRAFVAFSSDWTK